MALRISAWRPYRSSHRGDCGIWVCNPRPISAGIAPGPSTNRQPVLAAPPGKALKMISATM